MLKIKCCLYVVIPIRFFSITICNLLIDFLSYYNSSCLFVGSALNAAVPQYLPHYVYLSIPYYNSLGTLLYFQTGIVHSKFTLCHYMVIPQ